MRAIKVFGGNWQGIERRIVATTSLTKACTLSGIGKNFMTETFNDVEVEVATKDADVVFGYNTREVRFPATHDQFTRIADSTRQVRFQDGYSGDEK